MPSEGRHRWPIKRALISASVFLFLAVISGCAGNRELILADEYGNQGRWDAAYQIYQEALKKDPTNIKLRERTDEVRKKAAQAHYEEGNRLIARQRTLAALEEIKQAIALDPSREEFQTALASILRRREAEENLEIGRKLIAAEKFSEARERFERALELNPELTEAKEAIQALLQAQKKIAEEDFNLTLKSTQPITLKFQNAKLADVFELLSKSSGINILFDKDVRPENTNISIFIKDASFKEALNLLLTTNGLFMKRISDGTILIIPKNKQKVDQYQDLMIRTFYLSNVKAKDMINLLRTMLETRRIMANDDVNAVIIRDTPEKIRLAEKILEANDRRKAEVMFDVEILEVDRTKSLRFGWNFNPARASASIHPPASATGNLGEITLNQLQNITDDLIFFTIPSIIIDFFKQESDAKTMANPRVRVIDGKTAKVNIGDRVPILLSTTTTAAAAVGSVPTTSSATSIEFKDVGIKLSAEPDIHLAGDMTLKLGLEVTSLGDAVDLGGGIKQFKFGTRTADTVLNVRDGETVVIGGLIRDEDRKTVNKIPGLGDIPLLGKLFSGLQTDKVKVDVLMTLTPHIVHGLEIPNSRLQSFWSGTEDSYATRPLFSDLSVVEESPGEGASSDGMFPAPPLPKPGGTSSPPGAALPAKVSIQPSDAMVPVNGGLTVEVKAENIRGVSEGIFSIAFDPNLLSFENGTEGDLLRGGGKPATFSAASKPGSGVIDVRIGRSDPEGIRGSGSLFKLAFKALRIGSSRIDFKGAQLTDKGKVPLAADAVSGFITVK